MTITQMASADQPVPQTDTPGHAPQHAAPTGPTHTNTAPTWVRAAIRLRRALAVGAVALTLAGMITAPADARDRGGAAYQANDAIDACFLSGGDPDVYEGGGSIAVWCFYEEGQGWDSVDFYEYED